MSIRTLTMYEVACDEDGCAVVTGTYGDWSCWGDPGTAVEDWTERDDHQAFDGKHYCDEHRKPECDGCEKVTDDLRQDAKGQWCPDCCVVDGQTEIAL